MNPAQYMKTSCVCPFNSFESEVSMKDNASVNPYILCFSFGIGIWVLTMGTYGLLPGMVLLPVCMWILKGLKLLPSFQPCGERWWGAMFLVSMAWPVCFFFSLVLVLRIWKTLNDGAKVLLWLAMSTLLTLSSAYPIFLWHMNDQLEGEAAAERDWDRRELAPSFGQAKEKKAVEWGHGLRPEAATPSPSMDER
jgi:hypothetical protein